MLDATSKGPEGLVDANTFSFGNFDQCIETKSKNLGIYGGYTLVDINFQPSVQVYPGFYDNDHSKDYEPFDQDTSTWEALKVCNKYCLVYKISIDIGILIFNQKLNLYIKHFIFI